MGEGVTSQLPKATAPKASQAPPGQGHRPPDPRLEIFSQPRNPEFLVSCSERNQKANSSIENWTSWTPQSMQNNSPFWVLGHDFTFFWGLRFKKLKGR